MPATRGLAWRTGALGMAAGMLYMTEVQGRPSSAQQDPAAAPLPPPSALIATLHAPGPRPSSSPEAGLFDRFVGSWSCEFSFRNDDGTVRRAAGEVNFGWIIDGWAIQDTWITYPADEGKERNIGTSIRFFDASSRTWRVVFVAPAFGALTTLQGRLEDDRIVLTGEDADGSRLRWSFNDMRPDSFVWRGEKSRDGGKTWRLEEEHRMKRRPAA